MKAKTLILWTVVGLALIGGIMVWRKYAAPKEFHYSHAEVVTHTPLAQLATPALPLINRIDAVRTNLLASPNPAATRALLDNLRHLLDSLPPDVASRQVQACLATGKDASTRMDIKVKQGGSLGDASSLRVFLLDYLGSIDKPAAGRIAVQVLSHYTTPDEWALCLRNYAWANPGTNGHAFLQTKIRELLTKMDWAKNPSVGFLEAFDTVVYTHDTSLTPLLSSMLRDKDNHAVGHAAFLTMDRLAIYDTAPMLKTLVENPGLMKGHEMTRADLVARADLGQPDQRALVEKYLLDPALNPQELATFSAIFPNANYLISDNLLTAGQTLDRVTLIQRDESALAVVEQWQNDPRFTSLQPALTQMRQRLNSIMQEAADNR